MSGQPIVSVKTKYGTVEGFTARLPSGAECDIFLGIPYAAPPVGSFRFEKPQPPLQWPDPLDAKEFGAASFALTGWPMAAEELAATSEDCLTLNIFRPAGVPPATVTRPVLVYCHGGGYCAGASRHYGYAQWCANFVASKWEFIFVTVQYRLGVLGFLSDGTNELAGNYGLWDQAAALRFLHENVSSFNGDPNHIVLWGLSAGAGSCAALAASPHSRDYIRASIEMSGTLGSAWSCSEQTVAAGREFIAICISRHSPGLPGGNIKNFLKKLPISEIQQIAHEIGAGRFGFNILNFHPRMDGDFLNGSAINQFDPVAADVNCNVVGEVRRPVLMGLTSSEAIYLTLLCKDRFLNEIGIPSDKLETFDAGQFRAQIAALLRNSDGFPSELFDAALDEICVFYLDGDNEPANSMNTTFYLKQYTKLFSDVMFNEPAVRVARGRAQIGVPTYLYVTEYFNPAQFAEFCDVDAFSSLYAATHGNEYPYINGIYPIGTFQFNDVDERHRRILVDIVGSFATTGHPTVDGLSDPWPTITADKKAPLQVLRLSERTSAPFIDKAPELEEAARFWGSFAQKFGFDLVSNRKLIRRAFFS